MNRRILTRRDLGRIVSGSVAALAWAGSGRMAEAITQAPPARTASTTSSVLFRLSSNENNYGLAPAAVDALKAGRSYANRYGGESTGALVDKLAALHGVPREHVLLAPGSGEILRAVTLAFTSPAKGLLTGSPSYESPERTAQRVKAAIKAVPVAADGTLDLAAMAAAASESTGLAFVCNPNNPTGGMNPAAAVKEFFARYRAAASEGYVLFDEAYADYVTDDSYATAIPITQTDKRVIVSRTFSKIHGMAGLRVGYAIAHPDTLALVRDRTSTGTLSSVSAGAALASLEDTAHLKKQRDLNRDARAGTKKAFEKAGYTVLATEANFVMVDVKRPSTEFAALCRQAGVALARPFPPLTTHSRITIGTAEEMKKAMALMLPLLTAPARTITKPSAPSGAADDDSYC